MPTTAQADWNKQAHGRAPEYGTTPQIDTATRRAPASPGITCAMCCISALAGVVVAFALIYAAFFA